MKAFIGFSFAIFAATASGASLTIPANLNVITSPLGYYVSKMVVPDCQNRVAFQGREFGGGWTQVFISYPLNIVKDNSSNGTYQPDLTIKRTSRLGINPQFWETSQYANEKAFLTWVIVGGKAVEVKVPKSTWRHYVALNVYAYTGGVDMKLYYYNSKLSSILPPANPWGGLPDQVAVLNENPSYGDAAGRYQLPMLNSLLPIGDYTLDVSHLTLGTWSTVVDGKSYCGVALREEIYRRGYGTGTVKVIP